MGELAIDLGTREARLGGRLLDLRPKEFDLLFSLAEHNGLVMSRDQLLDLVWGYEFPGGTRTVDAHISHLRAHLDGSDVTIESVADCGHAPHLEKMETVTTSVREFQKRLKCSTDPSIIWPCPVV